MKLVRLLYAASETNADMLYATRILVPDPFLWWEKNGETFAAFSRLEVDRARRLCSVQHVLATEEILPSEKKRHSPVALILAVSRKFGFRSILVPPSFPVALADALRRKGLKVRVGPSPFFPGRAIKTEKEVEHILQAVRMAEAGLKRALEILERATIGKDNRLRWRGGVLTSERLRSEIEAVIVEQGGMPWGTIVAGGKQACDPHERGSGPLPAGEPIVLDIFPRDSSTGYYGDLTRTVVKGRAPGRVRKLYHTVAEGKRRILRQLKDGVDGAKLQRELVQWFQEQGYPTEKREGRWVGFFHGLGHGLGLEIHEPPRFGSDTLHEGNVVTVEPGLYYPELGGVRLEDVVWIRKEGIENLTSAPERLEIP
ncbi:M24 family metallopeptidase [Candidatus Methylacidithermus pantelleriae]|uniref:Xaa-Pro aminopeptidase n=1 Tax=Candidatus Methylacidithermus pantelleriae TaxID=2744239 RepID=A0A8J2BSA5_9BACT|nr:Xaa-Pro peptidase family protein [Candidatus Methylacidithermus pantelleriae]CAF0696115.1 Xaa-Pro aminopeptidase [Candidatus Methylacidithermus pantelleriae]